ncbi:SIMPL domain-containing protein [Nodosilinea sp. E11]|uniref:SIMPL domain-containing protein n=1 Tax=Nodosilinea sp. E11 TaxID=3037479 RepID=UPI00293415B2|nr:SIMPL domain-containing protein [Nodosilinea sp. E11]WOD40256.1 SIMPL domain-containing protein [Nodosilinea sp. E11]
MTMKHYAPKRLTAVALMSMALAAGLSFTPRFTPTAIAQEITMRTLMVTGQGEESVPTTKTQVDLGVDVQGTDAAAVQREVAQRTAAVVELLRSRQVEKLETTGIQLSPRYNYENGRSEVIGYSGSNTVQFRMPTERVGTLLDDAVNAGANQIRGISFVADDAALEAARQAALRNAVDDAQAQANTVLNSLNLRPEEVVSIQINGAASPPPVPMPRVAEYSRAQADVATPVVGGEQTVQAQVTLQIRY